MCLVRADVNDDTFFLGKGWTAHKMPAWPEPRWQLVVMTVVVSFQHVQFLTDVLLTLKAYFLSKPLSCVMAPRCSQAQEAYQFKSLLCCRGKLGKKNQHIFILHKPHAVQNATTQSCPGFLQLFPVEKNLSTTNSLWQFSIVKRKLKQRWDFVFYSVVCIVQPGGVI